MRNSDPSFLRKDSFNLIVKYFDNFEIILGQKTGIFKGN